MRSSHFCLVAAACCLSLPSCDKLKQVAEKTKKSLVGKTDSAPEPAISPLEPAVEAELQALVDHTAEGYIFRKDLPFPAEIRVHVESAQTLKGHFTREALEGKQAMQMNATIHTAHDLNRHDDTVTAEVFEGRVVPHSGSAPEVAGAKTVQTPDGSTEPVAASAPKLTASMTFNRHEESWRQKPDGKLSSAMTGSVLVKHFPEILSADGLAPRPFWFGKRRLKIGDEISLTGDQLRVVMPYKAKGKILLKLESIDSLGGHPCGVFAISGNYDADEVVEMTGEISSEKVTIQSGKFWLSLIYPVVLKEDYEAILTTASATGNTQTSQGQGSLTSVVERDWKPARSLPK